MPPRQYGLPAETERQNASLRPTPLTEVFGLIQSPDGRQQEIPQSDRLSYAFGLIAHSTTPTDRGAYRLRHAFRLSYSQIAAEMGCSPSTAYARVSRVQTAFARLAPAND